MVFILKVVLQQQISDVKQLTITVINWSAAQFIISVRRKVILSNILCPKYSVYHKNKKIHILKLEFENIIDIIESCIFLLVNQLIDYLLPCWCTETWWELSLHKEILSLTDFNENHFNWN